jgi:hypothetical protein
MQANRPKCTQIFGDVKKNLEITRNALSSYDLRRVGHAGAAGILCQ